MNHIITNNANVIEISPTDYFRVLQGKPLHVNSLCEARLIPLAEHNIVFFINLKQLVIIHHDANVKGIYKEFMTPQINNVSPINYNMARACNVKKQ